MVRRLKHDIREISDSDFPQREVIPVTIQNLPEDAPELELSRLLPEYRLCRQARVLRGIEIKAQSWNASGDLSPETPAIFYRSLCA